LVRAYYYDADVDIRDSRERSKESEAKHDEIDQRLSRIKQEDFYQVRLGRLKSTKGRYKQKGVDVLLATDMVVKAYQGEYDTAVVLTGDDDLVDAIEAIKHIGKTVYGIFFVEHCSQTLRDSFDVKIPMPSKFDPKLFLRRDSQAGNTG
jgi:uncharacterized LabA/DUF88 family protein